jgi:HIT zinc finger
MEHAPIVSRDPPVSRTVTSAMICQVCDEHRDAPYTCPKCRIPYCSVACYRNHTTTSSQTDGCTESFYQSRVAQVLQLEVKERKDDMHQILQKFYNDQRNNNNSVELSQFLLNDDEDDDKEAPPAAVAFSTPELRQLWEALENCGQSDDDWENLVRSSPHIQTALVHMTNDQQSGRARLEEWCLEPWHPWWLPQLTTRESTEDDEDDDDADADAVSPHPVSLDECILTTPAFHTICRARSPHPAIPYNLVDILYGIVVTLRLYHGVDNSADVKDEAVAALLHHSRVLQQPDCCFDSLDTVLQPLVNSNDHYNNSNNSKHEQQQQQQDQHDSRRLMMMERLRDVAVILGNHRLVARALWEGQAMLQRVPQTRRRLAKKMVYYRSWSLAHVRVVEQLAADVEIWLQSEQQQQQQQHRGENF